ncbi:MAG TPA: hypothetical protein VEH84_04890 [Alphaproteobacteria bacterium]|nr:hypothetical protein [Alphaproteobacteria bacterium]
MSQADSTVIDFSEATRRGRPAGAGGASVVAFTPAGEVDELLRAYRRIGDARKRQKIRQLVEAIAQG